jgi:hypothetical protein
MALTLPFYILLRGKKIYKISKYKITKNHSMYKIIKYRKDNHRMHINMCAGALRAKAAHFFLRL